MVNTYKKCSKIQFYSFFNAENNPCYKKNHVVKMLLWQIDILETHVKAETHVHEGM